MAQRNPRLWKNSHFREVVGTVGILAILLLFTEMTLQALIPIIIVFGGMVVHDIAKERYDLPNGTNWLVYGMTIIVAGAYLAILGGIWLGGLLTLVGCWFAFDGATTIRYEPRETTHEYVLDLDNRTNEMMLRMQTLNSVYQRLRNARELQTAAELAADLDLTESRTESALDFLESKGYVEQVRNRYCAEPPRWGRATPAVRFFRWLPRRVLRPFRRVAITI